MKKHSDLLFWIGILISLSGFVMGQADHIPFIFRIVSPRYYGALEAKEELLKTRILTNGNRGFIALSEVLHDKLVKNGFVGPAWPREFLLDQDHVDIPIKKQMIASYDPVIEWQVRVIVDSGEHLQWGYRDFNESIANEKNGSIFLISIAVFIFGILVNILSWRLKAKESIPKALNAGSIGLDKAKDQ